MKDKNQENNQREEGGERERNELMRVDLAIHN